MVTAVYEALSKETLTAGLTVLLTCDLVVARQSCDGGVPGPLSLSVQQTQGLFILTLHQIELLSCLCHGNVFFRDEVILPEVLGQVLLNEDNVVLQLFTAIRVFKVYPRPWLRDDKAKGQHKQYEDIHHYSALNTSPVFNCQC